MHHVRLNACRLASAIATLFSLGPTSASAAPAETVVTLITGDRVTVDSAGNAVVRPAVDRTAISFQIVKTRDHIQVIPSDALAPLRAGQVDPRLFDVTELAAAGYNKRTTTPVIVTGLGSAAAGKGASALAGATQGSAARKLALVNGVAVAAAQDGALWRSWNAAARSPAASAVAADSTSKLWLDGRRQLSVEDNLKQIGADVAHERGLLGDGVKVAVIDSGIDVTHPDLEGQVKAQKNFVSDEEDDRDYVGHGTHVASIIAGTGAQSKGRYLGVAPHAELIDAKACSREGCLESAILESLEWAADRGARIINMSFGAMDRRGEDLIEAAVNKLSKERGVLIVAAAGNDFIFGFPVGSPASADAALAVGSLSPTELPSDFSQRGRLGELTIKPELVAPGENITAARSNFMEEAGEAPAEGYFTASGTSMAAPHVAGAAALLCQRHPEWKGHQLKAVLMGSAKQLDRQSALEQGAGLVNIPSALALQLRAEPAAVSFGRPEWPHADDKPVEKKLTLHNESDEAVTLTLTVEVRGANGASADPDLFSISDTKVELAAHDQTSVTLTADTRKGEDGLYSGTLLATGKDASLHVPFVVDREVESYDLDLRFVDKDGEPLDPQSVFSSVVHWEQSEMPTDVYVEDDSTASVRLARGSYAVTSHAFDEDEMVTTELVYPELTLDRDREIVMDGSVAKPLQIDAPLPEAVRAFVGYSYDVSNYGSGTILSGEEGSLLIARLGPSTDRKEIGTTLSAAWIAPGAPEDSEYQFNWARFLPGEHFTGYHKRTKLEDYAEVDTKFARGGSPAAANIMAMGLPADPEGGYSQASSSVEIKLPGRRRMYYAVDSALEWNIQLDQSDFETGVFDSWEELARFAAGECYEQQWNQAVFGPAATSSTFGPIVQTRYGDTLQIAPALLADHRARSGWLSQSPGAQTRLFRDGELIEELDELGLSVDVPAESARYRVELELDRPAPAELSTHVELAWEFVSAHSGDEGVALPLSYVRFLPELDQDSAAAKGKKIELPIRVEAQAEAEVSEPESLTVEVSYDDGQSWSEVEVEGKGVEWTAQLEHPQQSGYVSLKATASYSGGRGTRSVNSATPDLRPSDADDNVVETTIIRAYRLQ